ncbi:hypothetical protein GCM10023096_69140 [Nonomuraea ferruginea]
MYRPPPDYPRASSSPTIILLVAGLTGVLGFLIGFLTGLGSGELAAAPAPRVTVTVEGELDPDTQPTDPVPSDAAPSDPAASDPAASPPAADPSASAPVTPDPSAGAPDDPVASNPGDPLASMRTLVVGVDIQPGTYRTTGPAGGTGPCYWARMNSTTGDIGDVIDAGMPSGPATVTIAATDKSFQTAGCAEWTRA